MLKYDIHVGTHDVSWKGGGVEALVRVPKLLQEKDMPTKEALMYNDDMYTTPTAKAREYQALAYADYLLRSKFVSEEFDRVERVTRELAPLTTCKQVLLFVQF